MFSRDFFCLTEDDGNDNEDGHEMTKYMDTRCIFKQTTQQWLRVNGENRTPFAIPFLYAVHMDAYGNVIKVEGKKY